MSLLFEPIKPLVVWLQLVFLIVFSSKSQAQTFDDRDAKLTEPQQKQLADIEARFSSDKKKLSQASKVAATRLNSVLARRDKARWAVLTPEQITQLLAAQTKEVKEKAERDHQFMVDIAPVMLLISQAETMAVYEGAHRESGSEIQKIPKDDEIRFGKCTFHLQQLQLFPEASQQLLSIVANYHSFETYRGPKFCGGFNPDVVFDFKKGDKSCQIMLCFGCLEASFIDDNHQFYTELNKDAYNKLLPVLKKQFQHWTPKSLAHPSND